MSSKPIHVVFDLPSGSRADVTFYNYRDAKFVYEAIRAASRPSSVHMVEYVLRPLEGEEA